MQTCLAARHDVYLFKQTREQVPNLRGPTDICSTSDCIYPYQKIASIQ